MNDTDFTLEPSSQEASSNSLGSISLTYHNTSRRSSQTALVECQAACLNYLQVLNSLCASGYRLAESISALEQAAGASPVANTTPHPLVTQYTIAWDSLSRATNVATSGARSHVINVLQDFVMLPDAVPGQLESINIQQIRICNQKIFMETAQTMINIQHQFCVASSASFLPLKYCFMCLEPVGFPHRRDCAMLSTASQRNQANSTMSSSERIIGASICDPQLTTLDVRGHLSNPGQSLAINTPGFPWNNQRRSSEATPGNGMSMIYPLNNLRRWSIPFEASSNTIGNSLSWDRINITSLSMSNSTISQCSSSGDSKRESYATSEDDLVSHAIRLLSFRPRPPQLSHEEHHNQ